MGSWGRRGPSRDLNRHYLGKIETKGIVGEDMLGYALEKLRHKVFLRFLDNVHLPSGASTGRSAECDFVVLSVKGYFCMEVKNWYCGKVFCGEPRAIRWEAEYGNDPGSSRVILVKNPILQNSWHTKKLIDFTEEKFESLILFTGSTMLVGGENYPNLLHIDKLEDYILSLPDIYSEGEVVRMSHEIYKLDTGEF